MKIPYESLKDSKYEGQSASSDMTSLISAIKIKIYYQRITKRGEIMEKDEAIEMLKEISKGKTDMLLVPFMYDWRDIITDYMEDEIKGDKTIYGIPEEAEIEEISFSETQADLIDEYVPLVLISTLKTDKEQQSITPTEYLMDSEGNIITLSDFEKKLGDLTCEVEYTTYTPIDIYHSELDTGDCFEHTNECETKDIDIEISYDLYKLPFFKDIVYSDKLSETIMEYRAFKENQEKDEIEYDCIH